MTASKRLDSRKPAGKVAAEPFRILHVFFPVINVRRADELPPNAGIAMNAEIQYGYDGKARRHLVTLRITSDKRTRDLVGVEVVASCFFEYTKPGEPTQAELVKFINGYASTAITARVIQLVGSLTAQMGMPPVWLPMPRGFGLTTRHFKLMKAQMEKGRELGVNQEQRA